MRRSGDGPYRLSAPDLHPGRDVMDTRASPQLVQAEIAASDGARFGDPTRLPTISFLLTALRRRWRLLCATAACGLFAALLFSLLFPPPHSATTILLLRHPAQSDAARAMLTDAELLKTRTVARLAIDQLHSRQLARDLVKTYDVLPLSDHVLRLTVKAPTGREAVRRANAVAKAFLEFRREEFERQSRAVVGRLEQRQADLSRELTTVVDSINSFPGGAGSEERSRELGDLLSRRAAISEQIGSLSQRIEAAVTDPTAVIERSRVLDPASENERFPLRALGINAAAGVVGGLAFGAGWILFQALASDRVRRSEEAAVILGAPTVATIGPLRGSLRTQRRRFLRHLAKPRPDIADAVHDLRSSFPSGELPPALLVGCVDSDGPGALLVASLAVELAEEQKRVLVVDLSRQAALSNIFDVARGKSSAVQLPGVASSFHLAFSGEAWTEGDEDAGISVPVDDLGQAATVVLALATLDPATATSHLAEWGPATVAVVTEGTTTKAALRTASETIRMAGLALHGLVVAGADPADKNLRVPTVFASGPPVKGRGPWNG